MTIINGVTTIDPDNTAYVASITATSQASSAIITGSGMIRISTQGNHVHLAFGATPTASVTTSFFMPTNTVEFFAFKSGEKVAFIGSSATGSISIIAVD
jgi:purine nucleoside phosphorylase